MGRTDVVINNFFSDSERFADLFNNGIFQGKKIISSEKLSDMDGTSRKWRETQKNRDLKKLYNDGNAVLIVIGLENQKNIHYAMPLRTAAYDMRSYEKEKMKITKKHRDEKDLKGDEWLSGFSKQDKLIPVITLVVYYGTKPWDGPRELHEMLNIPEDLQPFKNFIMNYKMNLLEVAQIEKLDDYTDDLKRVFGFIKYQKDKKRLLDFVNENKRIFSEVPQETCRTIQELTHSKEIMKYVESEKEVVNMCQAIQDLITDSKMEGENIAEERLSKLTNILLHEKNYTLLEQSTNDANLRRELYKKYNIE